MEGAGGIAAFDDVCALGRLPVAFLLLVAYRREAERDLVAAHDAVAGHQFHAPLQFFHDDAVNGCFIRRCARQQQKRS